MRIRPVDADRDFDAALAVLQASDRDVYGDTDWTPAELREQWTEIDPSTDAWVAEDGGSMLGVMTLCERRGDTFIGDGYVAPRARGRGVGTALVGVLEARVREKLAVEPADNGRAKVHLAHLVGDDTAPALLRGLGFSYVRSFLRMVRRLDGSEPAPAWPDGVDIRPFDLVRDGRAIHATDVAAFTGQWGYRAELFDPWRERVFGAKTVDPSLPVVAWSGDAVAGFALNYPKRMGDWGWIGVLGVDPAWRRRGLGLALLHESYRRFGATGETTVALGVDTENPTGATRLYERAGMYVLWRADVWEKEVGEDG
jgi:mycothiol synthase